MEMKGVICSGAIIHDTLVRPVRPAVGHYDHRRDDRGARGRQRGEHVDRAGDTRVASAGCGRPGSR